MHNTTACSGGFRYSPTTSMSLSSKRGSFESLNDLRRCGFRPRPDQIRWTVAGLTPTRFAIDRQLQWVAPAGVSCWVRRMISSILSAEIRGLRPRPARTRANLANPSRAKRSRHARTVAGVTPTPAAILALATPSAARTNTLARCTARWAAVEDRASTSNDPS